jgi:transcriptional regulator of acetoin/glycerol metabolism
MLTRTATAQHGSSDRPDDAADDAGVVLLYAEGWEKIPPALALRSAVVVGRDAVPTGLCVPQQAVSRVHARFSKHNGTWIISDLSSRNGTFVNGARVTRAPLAHGDQIRVGDALFKFVASDADEYAPYRIDGSGPHDPGPTSEMKGGLQIHRLLEALKRIAQTMLTVLVHGETGTGKELAARAFHRLSGRTGRMCAINCAAIPSGLIESELFGYKRGAFTGATHDRQGLLRAANGGTLLLDEIGDMPLETQAKLLRVLETREVVPLGSAQAEPVDVRVVSATHRDLRQLVDAGTFRGDLFARISGSLVELPPVRDRKEDVFQLARHFASAAGRAGEPTSFRFVDALLAYGWPFNVRELEAAIRHAAAMAGDSELDVAHLPRSVTGTQPARRDNAAGPDSTDARSADGPRSSPHAGAGGPSPEALRSLLARHRGNVAAVARELGKDRAQIHRWLRYAAINPGEYR